MRDGQPLTELSRDAWRLWRFLSAHHTGRHLAIKAASSREDEASIQKELGIAPRELQGDDGLVAELAATGRFVASSSAAPMGYYVPASDEEFVPYLEHMRGRRDKLSLVVSRAEKHLEHLREKRLRMPAGKRIVPTGLPKQDRMFVEVVR